MNSEKSLQDYIKKGCIKRGCLVYKFASPNKRGVPDLIIITHQGIVLFVEVKSPTGKGKLSRLQEIEIEALRDHGMYVEVVDSKDGAKIVFDIAEGRCDA